MGVCVVVCAYTMDRWDDLDVAVGSCLAQTLKPEEVIVVIDHNEELLQRASLELKGALVVANRFTTGLSGARNTGIASSSSEVVAFLDDDAYAQSDWLEKLMGPLADPKVAGVGGWILPDWPDGAPAWFPETFYWVLGCSYEGQAPGGDRLRNPIGANMALRRRVFATVGGFISGVGRIGQLPLGCEETEICIRYSTRFPDEGFVLVRDAVVHHRVPSSRLTWHYFWTRCWAEGLSKATVSLLVGSGAGLAAERRHLAHSLPRELARSLGSLPRHPRRAAARIALIVAGTACVGAGLLKGWVAMRWTPLEVAGPDLEPPMTPGDESGS
jgi:glycosyltransferase involved in cell wall biosynthesis